MDSHLGLIVQLNGVFLITILSIFLRRSLKITALKYWATAWLCLSFALICLRLGFAYEQLGKLLFTYYFLGEYMFGFLLVAGCRNLSDNFELRARTELYMVPFVIIAVGLPLYYSDFNEIYNVHSLVLACFFAAAFIAIRRSALRSFGWSVMHVALGLLTVNFFLYSVVFTARKFFEFDESFLSYNSIVDLVLQTSLGFGMVLVLLEKVLSDFQRTNSELVAAHQRLEELARTDALTAAFNRHAFYGFVNRHSDEGTSVSGCVGFFDIDGLKGINDSYGHSVGDLVIRKVVSAIRSVIRAEDLIFRWGGDEFFVVMISMDSELAELRMSNLAKKIRGVRIKGVDEPMNIGVSWGFKDFDGVDGLEIATKNADSAMYGHKRSKKTTKRGRDLSIRPPQLGTFRTGFEI